jgi:hypothetical protein
VVREALQEEEGQKEAASQQEGEDKGGKKAKTPKGALVAIAHFRWVQIWSSSIHRWHFWV